MNRIQISPLATLATARPNNKESQGKESQVGEAPSTFVISHQQQLFMPMHYEKKHAYPLIVWFHSAGDDASQILRVMPDVSLRNYVAVAPQADRGSHHQGYFWSQKPEGIEHAYRATENAIDHAMCRLNVAAHRVFLAGYGAGGTMAMRVGMKMVERVAGVISVNGSLPQGYNPLGNWKSCRQLPVLWAHCQKSLEFPEQTLCDQLKLLHVGGFNVTVRQYPFGDELPALALRDIDRWIMESISSAIM
jgi:phospholipase/carboxylesterase